MVNSDAGWKIVKSGKPLQLTLTQMQAIDKRLFQDLYNAGIVSSSVKAE
jgi:fido (protein-threonine AMPylation protein)